MSEHTPEQTLENNRKLIERLEALQREAQRNLDRRADALKQAGISEGDYERFLEKGGKARPEYKEAEAALQKDLAEVEREVLSAAPPSAAGPIGGANITKRKNIMRI
jgi:multidrug resistance efflux pump